MWDPVSRSSDGGGLREGTMAIQNDGNLAHLMAVMLKTTGPFMTDDPDAEVNMRLAALMDQQHGSGDD